MQLNDKQIDIIKIAEKLFAEHGFDGTSIRQISKEAHINVAMVSYYFGSKEKLLEALIMYRIADFRSLLADVIAEKKAPLETLDAIVALIVKRMHNNRRIYKIVNIEYSNNTRQIDFESYLKEKEENLKIIESFVKSGQESGHFTKNVNIKLLTATIIGTYFQFYYNKKFYQSILNITNNDALDYYVHHELTQHIQHTLKALLTNDK